jgi:hypothetical protein
MTDILDRKKTRILYYFPIIHSQADMGALKESVEKVILRKAGGRNLENKIRFIDSYWDAIEKAICTLNPAYETVRLYQDGLPVCGMETKIVSEIAEAGSRNHELLIRLMKKGAVIMGTESPELIVKEYNLIKQVLNEGNSLESAVLEARLKPLYDELLKKRDQYIADRINDTLCIGETGILFLGMLHSLDKLLANDITVIYPTIDLGGNT